MEKWYIHFSVADSGTGIKEEDLGKLFRLFGKLKTTASINESGVGLGLTISKKLTEALGGHIEVHSRHGHGTEFKFFIEA